MKCLAWFHDDPNCLGEVNQGQTFIGSIDGKVVDGELKVDRIFVWHTQCWHNEMAKCFSERDIQEAKALAEGGKVIVGPKALMNEGSGNYRVSDGALVKEPVISNNEITGTQPQWVDE